jgi:hypothetical protein
MLCEDSINELKEILEDSPRELVSEVLALIHRISAISYYKCVDDLSLHIQANPGISVHMAYAELVSLANKHTNRATLLALGLSNKAADLLTSDTLVHLENPPKDYLSLDNTQGIPPKDVLVTKPKGLGLSTSATGS